MIVFFFSHNGPLSSFSNIILISYSLGLIDLLERKELDTVRQIRNALAHSPLTISFSDDLVATECKKLSIFRNIKLVFGFVPKDFDVACTDPKQMYIHTILYFYAKLQRLQIKSLSNAVNSLKIRRTNLRLVKFILVVEIKIVRFKTFCYQIIARVRHFVKKPTAQA